MPSSRGRILRAPLPVAAVAAGATAWTMFRRRSQRRPGMAVAAEYACPAGDCAVADLSPLGTDAASVAAQPWDTGTGLAGYVWPAPHPRGDARLLLQHGYAEYTHRYLRHYNGLIPALLHAGISVYAVDLWGHGHSPGSRAFTDARRAVDDHQAARDCLEGLPGPLFLLGHSLGGLVTAASVVRDGHGIAGVILSSPFLKAPAGVGAATRMLATAVAGVAPALPAPGAPADVHGLSRLDAEIAAFTGDPLIHHGRMPVLLAASSLRLLREIERGAPAWTVPTLFVHGTTDSYTDPDGSRELYAAIGSPDKRLHIVEGGRHELLNDLERDAVLRSVLTWLEERIPGEHRPG